MNWKANPIFSFDIVQLDTRTHFHLNPSSRDLVTSFIEPLENLATRSKPQTKINFLQIQTAIKCRLARLLETLNQRRSHCVRIAAEDENSENNSSQFLQTQKQMKLLTCRNYFRVTPIYYQSLGSTVRGTILSLSRVNQYFFL